MKYKIYDFDGTIYDGDSSVDFFLYCSKRNKWMYKMLPKMLLAWIQYKSKMITQTEMKEVFFSFLSRVNNIEDLVKDFWVKHDHNIKKFYLEKKHDKDIIISASPEFLLKDECKSFGIKGLIASDVEKTSGKFGRPNCRGEEKVVLLNKLYPGAVADEMYSDSLADKPLLDLANKSYFVKKNKIYDYRTYKPNILKRFWNWGWSIYHKKEELWNYLIVGGLTTVVSIGSYALFSKGFGINYVICNILSWVAAVIFAYYTNRWFVFHSKNKNKLKEFISFTGSRVITLLMDTGMMVLFVDIIKIDDLIAKIIVQVVVVIANYIISKLLVFKK